MQFWNVKFEGLVSYAENEDIEIRRELSSSSLSAHKGGVTCTSEAIDISPGNLHTSLSFIQPSISLDVLCI